MIRVRRGRPARGRAKLEEYATVGVISGIPLMVLRGIERDGMRRILPEFGYANCGPRVRKDYNNLLDTVGTLELYP